MSTSYTVTTFAKHLRAQNHPNYSNMRHLYATLTGRIYGGPPQDIEDLLAALSWYEDSYPVSSFVTVEKRPSAESKNDDDSLFVIVIKFPDSDAKMTVIGRPSEKIISVVVFHAPGVKVGDTTRNVPVSELHEHYWNFLSQHAGMELTKE